jgi:beta-xylosidase
MEGTWTSDSPPRYSPQARFPVFRLQFSEHVMTKSSLAVASFILLAACASVPLTPTGGSGTRVLSWGDQGDGTYKNPILKADYSDPDIVRVGDDFYLVASDFHFSTMQVLHSKDLVNWSYVGKIFDRLSMSDKYDQMRGYAEGTWAPSIRYHNGEFYVFVCTPSEGLFMWHAKNPAGPWSETVTVKAIANWEDPCPFWDDDGSAYLVHSLKGAGPIIINKMAPDGTKLLDDGTQVYRGQTAEGPKMHKRNGYYYISLPEGGVSAGGQTVLRSKNVYGPYERKVVLDSKGEHQGGLVDLDNGESWFICFRQMRGTQAGLGRICFLEPVTWGADDWPVFGDNGQTVTTFKKPNAGKGSAIERPATSDEFSAPTLGLQWQWNHNPLNEKWSLTERPGFLRLYASPPLADLGPTAGATLFRQARNTLTQKLWDDAGVVEIKIDVSQMVNGQQAGLAMMTGSNFGWVGVSQEGGQCAMNWTMSGPVAFPALDKDTVYLRATYQGDQASFAYSVDGKKFTETPAKFRLGFSSWKGSRPAVYCFGPNAGYVDVDYFHYTYAATLAEALAAAGQ